MQVKKEQLDPDMEQQTGSKLGKEYVKAVYCHPAYLNSMQGTSCEILGWVKPKLESRLLREISVWSPTGTLRGPVPRARAPSGPGEFATLWVPCQEGASKSNRPWKRILENQGGPKAKKSGALL